jgi:hypothetical protein
MPRPRNADLRALLHHNKLLIKVLILIFYLHWDVHTTQPINKQNKNAPTVISTIVWCPCPAIVVVVVVLPSPVGWGGHCGGFPTVITVAIAVVVPSPASW